MKGIQLNLHYFQMNCILTRNLPISNISDKNNIMVNNNELMTWREAQLYCRKHHTDLPSVKNQIENKVLQNLVLRSGLMWIGLFRDSWKWSDQSDSSFRYWGPNQPINRIGNQNCTAVWEGVWTEHHCMHRIPFVCYGGESSFI
jgi:hypothetical protein